MDEAVDAALRLAEKGKLDQARAALTDLHRENPRNHSVCYGLGTLHAVREEYEQAIRWFDQATAIFPCFAEAYFNKAVAYQRQLDVGNAIRAYRKVVEVGSPHDAIVKKARSFLEDMAETIRRTDGVDLDAYLEAQAQFDKAFAHMERGEWLRALEGFRACLAWNERHAPTHGNMGICYAKLGRKAEALAALARALEIAPDYRPAMINRTAFERMEEGRPLDLAAFERIDYGKECARQERARRRSLLGRIAGLFGR